MSRVISRTPATENVGKMTEDNNNNINNLLFSKERLVKNHEIQHILYVKCNSLN